MKVWIAILLSASHNSFKISRSDGSIIQLEIGDFAFGRIVWSKWLKIPEGTIRNWMSTFKKRNQIEDKVVDSLTPSVLRVVSWEKYQIQDSLEDIIEDSPQDTTNNVPTNNELTKAELERNSFNEKGFNVFVDEVVNYWISNNLRRVDKPDLYKKSPKLRVELEPDFMKLKGIFEKKRRAELLQRSDKSANWTRGALMFQAAERQLNKFERHKVNAARKALMLTK